MDETGWQFELRFTGQFGVHPDRSHTIMRSDDMIGAGGRVIVTRIGADVTTEVEYKDLSRLAPHDISVGGTVVVRVRRALLGGNILGEWVNAAAKQAASIPVGATPTGGQQVSATDQADDARFETERATSRPAEQGDSRAAIRIDSTFGGSGAAFGDFMGESAVARAVVAQPDGHVIVVGTVGDEQDPDGRSIGLIRFDENGRRDPHFGNDGYKILDLEGVDNVARALALQPDGKIIVAGEIFDPNHGSYDFALVRLDASGQLDMGFGGGVVATDLFSHKDDRAYAVAVQADGKVVAGGYTSYLWREKSKAAANPAPPDDGSDDREGFALVRYNADGSLDPTFAIGGRGTTVTALQAGGRARIRALHVQADGRILTAGFATPANPDVSQVALTRHTVDGNLDRTFGPYGLVFFSSAGADEGAHALAVQPDGRIVIAGGTARDATSDQHFLLARLNPDGTLDQTFGGTGTVVNRDFVGLARGVVILPDQRVVAAGSAAVTAVAENGERVTREQVALVCYMRDGSVDETFGTGGVLFIDLGGNEDSAAGIVLSGDKIFVAGTSRLGAKSEFALICLVQNQ